MIFHIEFDDKIDLSTFRSMFFELYGKDVSTYNLLIDDIALRVEVIPLPPFPAALTRIGLFERIISTAPQPQIHPCQDVRFRNLSIIQESFLGLDWCNSYDPDKAFSTIEGLLKTVHKVNKLKAFL